MNGHKLCWVAFHDQITHSPQHMSELTSVQGVPWKLQKQRASWVPQP